MTEKWKDDQEIIRILIEYQSISQKIVREYSVTIITKIMKSQKKIRI